MNHGRRKRLFAGKGALLQRSAEPYHFANYGSPICVVPSKLLTRFLHQLPIGNSNNLNTASDCGSPTDTCTPRTGYKDNRPEYFLNYDAPSSKSIRDAHLRKFADAGVFALLFGGTEGGSTTSYNDTWTDENLFLKSRVAQLVADTNGGYPIQ